ncbi:MAG: LPS export ABC transporter ATP-binding protein [Pirellula sp.]
MQTESTDVLNVIGLEKTYGRRKVVNGVSMRVGAGEIVGLLGPNGAGKSTSFRMTCGMVHPDRGQVFLGGEDVTYWPMFLRARDGGMGYLAQDSSVFRKLNVEQNISAMLEMLGYSWSDRRKRTEDLLQQFSITHIRKSPAAKLSGGERRRLEIARCLVSNPRIIMLDEPYAGIDPVTVQSIQQIIFKLRDSGISILITDHAALEILSTVDRCYVISKGVVLCEGTPAEVKKHPEVRKQYLGNLQDSPSPADNDPTPAPAAVSSRTSARRVTASASPSATALQQRSTEIAPAAPSPSTSEPTAREPFLRRISLRRRGLPSQPTSNE